MSDWVSTCIGAILCIKLSVFGLERDRGGCAQRRWDSRACTTGSKRLVLAGNYTIAHPTYSSPSNVVLCACAQAIKSTRIATRKLPRWTVLNIVCRGADEVGTTSSGNLKCGLANTLGQEKSSVQVTKGKARAPTETPLYILL